MFTWIGGEWLTCNCFSLFDVSIREGLQSLDIEFGDCIDFELAKNACLNFVEFRWADVADDTTIHINKATVAIPGKLWITSLLGQTLCNRGCHTNVENGLHHAGH